MFTSHFFVVSLVLTGTIIQIESQKIDFKKIFHTPKKNYDELQILERSSFEPDDPHEKTTPKNDEKNLNHHNQDHHQHHSQPKAYANAQVLLNFDNNNHKDENVMKTKCACCSKCFRQQPIYQPFLYPSYYPGYYNPYHHFNNYYQPYHQSVCMMHPGYVPRTNEEEKDLIGKRSNDDYDDDKEMIKKDDLETIKKNQESFSEWLEKIFFTTPKPTEKVSDSPIYIPTHYVTEKTTSKPIYKPTYYPTEKITTAETTCTTEEVTHKPSYKPTYYPTEKITHKPTEASTPETTCTTEEVTHKPSYKPTYYPTEKITHKPTEASTPETTCTTEEVTHKPSYKPTYYPTEKTTHKPTEKITHKPTEKVTYPHTEASTPETTCTTEEETHKPTEKTTQEPTHKPTYKPTHKPTHKPTRRPTRRPTHKPTSHPYHHHDEHYKFPQNYLHCPDIDIFNSNPCNIRNFKDFQKPICKELLIIFEKMLSCLLNGCENCSIYFTNAEKLEIADALNQIVHHLKEKNYEIDRDDLKWDQSGVLKNVLTIFPFNLILVKSKECCDDHRKEIILKYIKENYKGTKKHEEIEEKLKGKIVDLFLESFHLKSDHKNDYCDFVEDYLIKRSDCNNDLSDLFIKLIKELKMPKEILEINTKNDDLIDCLMRGVFKCPDCAQNDKKDRFKLNDYVLRKTHQLFLCNFAKRLCERYPGVEDLEILLSFCKNECGCQDIEKIDIRSGGYEILKSDDKDLFDCPGCNGGGKFHVDMDALMDGNGISNAIQKEHENNDGKEDCKNCAKYTKELNDF